MMRAIFCAIAAIIITACLLGCVGVTVDEKRVFQPPAVANKATRAEDMKIDLERVFTRPSNYTFTNNINNDRSTIRVEQEDFIPATINHDFWADGSIAVTEIAAASPSFIASPTRPLVVHCGGNASDRYSFGAFFGLKVLPYADLILFDYPGYGDSPGAPSAASFETMIDNLALTLNERRAQSNRPLILWGYSLGGFVCARLSGALENADAVILESSANNATDAAKYLVPAILRPFLRVRLSPSLAAYDNVLALKTYDGPVLVLAGAEDGILPATLSRALADALRSRNVSVTYHEFAEGNHANLATLDSYKEALTTFFARWPDVEPD